MPTIRGTHFPVGTYYGDPSEGIPPHRPQSAHPAPVKRSESARLVPDRKPKCSSPRLNKVKKEQRLARRVVLVVVDPTPNNKPGLEERQRFLKRLGVA